MRRSWNLFLLVFLAATSSSSIFIFKLLHKFNLGLLNLKLRDYSDTDGAICAVSLAVGIIIGIAYTIFFKRTIEKETRLDPYKSNERLIYKSVYNQTQLNQSPDLIRNTLEKVQSLEIEYERFAWETVRIFLPITFALIGYALNIDNLGAASAVFLSSFFVYMLGLAFFSRFRHNIRTYRTISIALEKELRKYGDIPISDLAENLIEKLNVPRVWTTLLTLGFILYPLVALYISLIW